MGYTWDWLTLCSFEIYGHTLEGVHILVVKDPYYPFMKEKKERVPVVFGRNLEGQINMYVDGFRDKIDQDQVEAGSHSVEATLHIPGQLF